MVQINHLQLILIFSTLALLPSCQEGCLPVDKSKDAISEDSRSKMAYTGTETLVFLEVDNGDSTELTFEPVEHFDSMLMQYSYYEAPNGDHCIGYESGVETIYREYYCKERDWRFLSAMTASGEEVLLRFEEKPYPTDGKYNFDKFIWSGSISRLSSDDSTADIFYLKKYRSLNGLNTDVTRLASSFTDSLFYDTKNGLLKWYFMDYNYSLILKSITRP